MARRSVVNRFRKQDRARAVGPLFHDLVIEPARIIDATRTDGEHHGNSRAQVAVRLQPGISERVESRSRSEK